MKRSLIAAALALVAFSFCIVLPADARPRLHTPASYAADPGCNVIFPCDGVSPSARGELVVKAMHGFGAARLRYTPRASSGRTSGVVATLAAKVAEITSACGSSVISGVRHTLIAGTRTISLHASGKAVDMTGNPSCIYQHLAGWPGGYSVDYARMRHVHISYDADGGREMGLHFRHGGGHRYAHRPHRHRYAAAG